MILKIIYKKQFEKELKKQKKRGKDLNKLKQILLLIVNRADIPRKYRNHKLVGNYKDRWECHIEPDWLLIYKLNSKELILERTGSHSDLFKN